MISESGVRLLCTFFSFFFCFFFFFCEREREGGKICEVRPKKEEEKKRIDEKKQRLINVARSKDTLKNGTWVLKSWIRMLCSYLLLPDLGQLTNSIIHTEEIRVGDDVFTKGLAKNAEDRDCTR